MEDVKNYREIVDADLKAGTAHREIARKIFLSYPTYAFVGREDVQYQIFDAVAKYFDVPITSVTVAGSAKTGFSFLNRTAFRVGDSDLDIAVVDPTLFQRYVELVYNITNGYRNESGFNRDENGKSVAASYKSYVAKGVIRPDFLPSCKQRYQWYKLFGDLSRKHAADFRSVTGAVYLSHVFFEIKQSQAISTYSAGAK